MDPAPRGGAAAAGAEHDARPALLPQLRPDLVRLHATRGRPHQDQVLGPLAGTHQGPRTTLKLKVSPLFITRLQESITDGDKACKQLIQWCEDYQF